MARLIIMSLHKHSLWICYAITHTFVFLHQGCHILLQQPCLGYFSDSLERSCITLDTFAPDCAGALFLLCNVCICI
jgi:hypothetical protein